MKGFTVATELGDLHGLSWGDPSLPPLLALHGWMDNAASFFKLAPMLAHKFHVVALDLPGHGHSYHRPLGSFYNFVDWMPDLLLVAEHFKWKTFTLMGHSLGGSIATLFAALYPERLEKLWLIDSLGPLSLPEEKLTKQAREYLALALDPKARVHRPYPSVQKGIDAYLSKVSISAEGAREIVARNMREENGAHFWRWDPRLRWPSPTRFTETQVRTFLKEVRVPTLCVRATKAQITDLKIFEERVPCFPDLKIVPVEAQHHLHIDEAEEVAKILFAS